ncbi:radical SAM protein [bacterium]|nr:radical SAM protein [Candidatus Omnitrophota bacterium]MBU2528223.1 radical SAM protein [bacterium]MBU3929601.1 radical SAM protein [bacterium]MBU4122528.1 radical SAM protein [bacterium]
MEIKNLLNYERPAQYAGGEMFSVKKPWKETPLKVLLVSPAVYQMGASSLGLGILYHIINSRPDSLCERAFMPEPDMREAILSGKEKFLSLESGRSPRDFDLIGITLPAKGCFFDIPGLFALMGIPVSLRDGSYPVITAGGPGVSNFVPAEGFFDAFIVGDGEEVIGKMLDEALASSGRDSLKRALADIEGVYVCGISGSVKKVFCPLKNDYYPLKPVIPNIRTLQDRLDIEVMRGCPNNCRFCEAKRFYSPLRVRTPEDLEKIIISSLENTGWKGLSLSSLSTPQYPHIGEVVDSVIPLLRKQGISLQIPSLRPERRSLECVMKILPLNQVNLTFAPETFSRRMQEIIGKITPLDEFEKMMAEIKSAGFRDVKIYLMLGLPGESDADMDENIKAVKRIRKTGLKVTLTLSPFVPAAHTPFERVTLWDRGEMEEKLKRFKMELRGVDLRHPSLEDALLESALARGDARLGAILLDLPAVFTDSSADKIRILDEAGLDSVSYAGRDFSTGKLPWEKIDIAPRAELEEDYNQVKELIESR